MEEKVGLAIMILVILSEKEKEKRTSGGRRRERALTISNTKTSGRPKRRGLEVSLNLELPDGLPTFKVLVCIAL